MDRVKISASGFNKLPEGSTDGSAIGESVTGEAVGGGVTLWD